MQQPFWNTVYHDRLPDEELLNMIDHAYEQVLHSFSRKVQKELETEPSETGEEECSDWKKRKEKRTETIHNGSRSLCGDQIGFKR